jgi:hypothetical protein
MKMSLKMKKKISVAVKKTLKEQREYNLYLRNKQKRMNQIDEENKLHPFWVKRFVTL